MAITNYSVGGINHYIGLAADTKPTTANTGDVFWEYDTQVAYINRDGTNWDAYAVGGGGGGTGSFFRVFTSSAATTTTITADALADVASEYIGQMVLPLQGTMAGEGRYITAYNGSTALTVSPAWAADPDADGNIQFAVITGALGILPVALGTNGTTVTDSATTVLGAIGANNADNAFASNLVVANADGSTLERLQYVQEQPLSVGTNDFNATCKTSIQAANAAALVASAYTRQTGVTQIFQKAVQQLADVGAYVLATVTTASCKIKSVTIKAVTAAQSELTTCAITCGVTGNITLIGAAKAAFANLDIIDDQVSETGLEVELAATKTITMTLVGTGHAAGNTNLLVTFEYCACAAGGYLV